MNFLQKLLSRGSQTAPKIIDEVTDIVPRVSDDLVEVGPQVIGKGTKAAPVADEAIDAVYKEITPTTGMDDMSWRKRIDPKLAGIVAALGIGGAAMMGGEDEQQIPMAPGIAKSQAPTPEAQVAQAKITPIERAKSVDQVSDVQQVAAEAIPEEAGPDFVKILEEAQATAKEDKLWANALRASEKIGAGLSRTKAEHGSSDIRRENADQAVTDTKGLIGSYKEQQTYNNAKAELNDDVKMRDPNSEVSKLTTELAIKAGLIKPGSSMSAMALKNSGVNIGNLLSTIEAGKARKESAALQREAMAASKGETNKLKIQGSVDRQVSQLLKSKDYEAYNAAKDAKSALDFALESGDKTASGSAFMQFAKIAQGDNSVVRDGDMAILAGGYNYTSPAQMITKLAAKAAGGNFNDDELRQMKAVAEKVQAIKGRRVQQLMSPVIERSEAAGLNLEESLDPAMIGEFTGKPEVLTTSGTRTFKSNQAPGSIVTVKSGKKYKIGADGVTGTEIP